MRLSELMHSTVVREDGRPLGPVTDVRVVADGPKVKLFGPALRVEGIVVGGPPLSVRLGFHRSRMRGPWLLKSLFGAFERRARYVRWEQVQSYDADRVWITGDVEALPEDD
jgi:hypothetical protein